ncbi:MAG: DUF308 domain-containing protein [Solobacterium sp.]|nr:DUF308 domain-containing protein [Solobacterium sp.]MBQ6592933.1 DUF308 domain-containing protein [Solobacterium sp.]MBR0479435.1 DUF308 domain-containing protein [Solobacterium sp.]MBR2727609.1 DUF308 domain-containing protein [Solobacterium sp.]
MAQKEGAEMNKTPIISGTLMTILGVFLLLFPGFTMLNAVRIVGVASLATGVLVLVSSMRDPVRSQFRLFDTFWGLVMVLMGFAFLRNPVQIVSAFPKIMGVFVFTNGLLNLLSVRKSGLGKGMAIVSIILGAMIFLNPFGTMRTMMRLVGAALIWCGVTGTMIRNLK